MVRIGSKVSKPLLFDGATPRTYGGRVVYIHPRGRFYIVEFQFERGRSFRETFMPDEKGG